MSKEPLLSSSLSEQAKKERTLLLASSAVGLFIAITGSVPTKFSTLGIELSTKEQGAFLVFFGLLTIYFLIAFIVYGVADFIRWRIDYQRYLVDEVRAMLNLGPEDQEEYDNDEVYSHIRRMTWAYRVRRPATIAVIGFEYVLPIIAAIGSILMLAFYRAST